MISPKDINSQAEPEESLDLSRRVNNYIEYRPGYPAALLDLLSKECHLNSQHIIADVGTGPGILAKLFLENGNSVIGIEPDPDMQAGADYYLQDFPQFTLVDGTVTIEHDARLVYCQLKPE